MMRKTMMPSVVAGLVVAGLGVSAAWAGSTVPTTWNFDVMTTGGDVFWMSPTSVTPTATAYDVAYELTSVSGTVTFLGAPFTVDVTDQLDPMLLMGSVLVNGPAPVVLVDQFIAAPAAPEPAEVSADVRIELDAMGFGVVSATNVFLGTTSVNIPPFGTVTVPITGIGFAGTLTVTPILTAAEDLDADGSVGSSDLAILLAAWGACPAAGLCPGDFDGDGSVGSSDLAILLAAWG